MASSRIKNTDFYASLGGTIRTLRELAGKTQEEVAAHLEVSFQQFQKYEDGRNRIPIDRLVSLARYFSVPLERFFSFAPWPGGAKGGPDLSRFLSAVKRQDVRLLELWSSLRDRRARSAVLAVLQWFSDQSASACSGFDAKRQPDSRLLGRER